MESSIFFPCLQQSLSSQSYKNRCVLETILFCNLVNLGMQWAVVLVLWAAWKLSVYWFDDKSCPGLHLLKAAPSFNMVMVSAIVGKTKLELLPYLLSPVKTISAILTLAAVCYAILIHLSHRTDSFASDLRSLQKYKWSVILMACSRF